MSNLAANACTSGEADQLLNCLLPKDLLQCKERETIAIDMSMVALQCKILGKMWLGVHDCLSVVTGLHGQMQCNQICKQACFLFTAFISSIFLSQEVSCRAVQEKT